MESCCEKKSCELELLKKSQKKVDWTVLVINLLMFIVEFTFGLISSSTSLLADSLDMLGDATVYAFTLYVIDKSAKWKAGAALLKGIIISLFGFYVLGEAIYKMLSDVTPVAETMGWVGGLALAANGFCLFLLYKFRDHDINMKSTWICSRNDIIANTSVLIAAFLVYQLESKWPDIVLGLLIAFVFLRSALYILYEAIREFKAKKPS